MCYVFSFLKKKMENAKEAPAQAKTPSRAGDQQQQVSNPINRKLNKILETRIENDKVDSDF